MEHHHNTNLYKALLLLETEEEVESFLKDLCTPGEIKAMQERWSVCQLLGKLSYRDIKQQTGSSLTTIVRVARFLDTEPYGGYRKILERINKNVKKSDSMPISNTFD